MTPLLIKIDLDKRVKNKWRCTHPDIKTDGTTYLAKLGDDEGGVWKVGTFHMQDYGLLFYHGDYNSQLSSGGKTPKDDGWLELYEIVDSDETTKW